MRKKFLAMAAVLVMVMGMAGVSSGAVVDWADWTSATPGLSGSAIGTIGSIGVSYNGEVSFAQTSGGTNYWIAVSPDPNPYISPVVANAPPAFDIIALVGGQDTANTISFTSPVTNPVMAIVSLGRPDQTVRYLFDQPFTVLSSGHGYWGGNPAGSLFDCR